MDKQDVVEIASTLEINSWVQVHRGSDEICRELVFATDQFRVSCTECADIAPAWADIAPAWNESRDFPLHLALLNAHLIEFAHALLSVPANPAGRASFEVKGGEDPEEFESCRVSVAKRREGVASLEVRYHTGRGQITGRIEIEAEETRTFRVEVPMHVVRAMAYKLLSKLATSENFFCAFELPPA